MTSRSKRYVRSVLSGAGAAAVAALVAIAAPAAELKHYDSGRRASHRAAGRGDRGEPQEDPMIRVVRDFTGELLTPFPEHLVRGERPLGRPARDRARTR